jgi:phosphohistidine phosphatase
MGLMRRKPAYFYDQSAVIPWRIIDGVLKIALISSRKGKKWVIPKGIIEPELDARESALKEAIEEAGLKGHISKEPVGTYSYEKWGGSCQVSVYLLEVVEILNEWEEDFRRREWYEIGEALELIQDKGLKEILEKGTNLPIK